MKAKQISRLLGATALTLPALWPITAHADSTTVNAIVVGTCGTQTLVAGQTRAVTQDTTGKFCTNASGGGGGGAVTAASGAYVDCSIVTIGCIGDTPWSGSGTATLDAAMKAMAQAAINSTLSDNTSNAGNTTKGTPVSVNSNTSCNTGPNGAAASNNTINKMQGDLQGNLCVRTTPNFASFVTGTSNAQTTGSSDFTIITATASKLTYVLQVNCQNSGATPVVVTFKNNTAGSTIGYMEVPAGGGNNISGGGYPLFATLSGDPLVGNMSAGTTSLYCNASGIAQ